jgi:hypothetical protein
MLIEHRTYTLQPGAEALFWQARARHGGRGLAPIIGRLLGAFGARSGPTDQVVSLYRYDSFEDWQTRLFGIYAREELKPYFSAVRPLIVRQESRFLVPAPIAELTPHWGNGRDRLPDHGPVFESDPGRAIVEQTTLSFSPGGVPACWEAFRRHGLVADAAAMEGVFAGFSSIVGALNEVIVLRQFADEGTLFAHRARRAQSAAWQGFMRSLAPHALGTDQRLLAPAPLADMAALFTAR